MNMTSVRPFCVRLGKRLDWKTFNNNKHLSGTRVPAFIMFDSIKSTFASDQRIERRA
jgi:hypothetical protein